MNPAKEVAEEILNLMEFPSNYPLDEITAIIERERRVAFLGGMKHSACCLEAAIVDYDTGSGVEDLYREDE